MPDQSLNFDIFTLHIFKCKVLTTIPFDKTKPSIYKKEKRLLQLYVLSPSLYIVIRISILLLKIGILFVIL
jgi:hypothetical protein